eukprot:1621807-Rhodomonas_salina.1
MALLEELRVWAAPYPGYTCTRGYSSPDFQINLAEPRTPEKVTPAKPEFKKPPARYRLYQNSGFLSCKHGAQEM